MKPYWSGDGIDLYHGDCRAVTEWLGADVLVTDPPYGRGWKQGTVEAAPGRAASTRSVAHSGIAGDDDTTGRDAALALWGDRLAIAFGDLTLAPPAGNRLTLVYRKPPDAGFRGGIAGWRRDTEAIYLIGPWPSNLGGIRSSIIETGARSQGNPSACAARYGHPHAKPVDVMETLIMACAPGVIADPFAGSGSTLIAARNQGRRAIGVEIDERYCERAARRLDQGILTEKPCATITAVDAWATARDLARLYAVSRGTIHRWASEDGWRRRGTRPKVYAWDDAQASWERRHQGDHQHYAARPGE